MKSPYISADKIENLEKRIDHRFKTHEQLVRALTHASAVPSLNDFLHYERFEFLGDRILGLCIAEQLFFSFPEACEGEMAMRLNILVSGKTCSDVSDEIGLHEFIFTGTCLKELTSDRMRSVRADVVESLIAAIYLDSGIESAKKFIFKFWNNRIHATQTVIRDSKTSLQEWAHSKGYATPVYYVSRQTGPDHAPRFVVDVIIEGIQSASGSGRSKRGAEQKAAEIILINVGKWIKHEDGTIQEHNV
ncbi:ribonuclease III [Candidatus Endowatersipora endosymbiont of Watersipora subatra]|uniref:ribonuclease III n=1 Tax=Candidatus Endowatersipora endosymbiont of Watersipora subatra TaxID=3077946 RepID=UPI00312CBA1E